MATNKNITMKQFNGTDYDTLYPKTKVEQVEGAYTQQQILANSTKTMFGLGADSVPDDAFQALSKSYRKKILAQQVSDGDNTIAFDLTTFDLTKPLFLEIDPAGNTYGAQLAIGVDKTGTVTAWNFDNMSYNQKTGASGDFGYIRGGMRFFGRMNFSKGNNGEILKFSMFVCNYQSYSGFSFESASGYTKILFATSPADSVINLPAGTIVTISTFE